MTITPWFERKFELITDSGLFPGIIERLEGTPYRLEDKVMKFSDEVLHKKQENKWSMQEHAGHLLNIEWLWYARFSDIINGEAYLTEADLTNQATFDANYNEQGIEDILDAFEEVRDQLISLLRTIQPTDFDKKSLHPRLNTPMKIIDLGYFIAEHDDHHLAIIQKLSQLGSVDLILNEEF